MKRALLLAFSSFLLVACQGSDIEIFVPAATAGRGGDGGGGDGGMTSGGSDTGGGGALQTSAGTAGMSTGGSLPTAGGPPGGTAGFSGNAGTPCSNNPDCPAGWLCKKMSCGDMHGQCELRPKFCPPDLVPVCGCDHVTYWNECYRRQAGQPASSAEDCSEGAHQCSSNKDCPPGAYCEHLLQPTDSCSEMLGPGSCWVTPYSCENSGDQMRWKPCQPPAGDAGATCVSTCEAVQAQRPYIQVSDGSCQ